jgi:hypothetical protein
VLLRFGSLTAGGTVDGAGHDGGDAELSPKRPIFSFLRSRGARLECPFCGKKNWEGWDERVSLVHVAGSFAIDRSAQAFPLTCRNCGFIRLQAAHVLDDPRASRRNDAQEGAPPMRALPADKPTTEDRDALE